MKNLNLLTLLLGILKMTGTVDWSWWIVLSPTFLGIALNILAVVFAWLTGRLR